MVFDISDFACEVKGIEGREGEEYRGLLLKDGIGREGKREGRGREEREKKGRGAACLNNKKIVPAALPMQ